MRFEPLTGIGIDGNLGALARKHSANVLFLEVRFDPRSGAVHDRQHAEPSHRHLANLQIVGILNDTVHRRPDRGSLEIQPRLVHRSPGLRDLRLLASRQRSMGICGTRLGVREILFGCLHLVECVLIIRACREALFEERLLPA